SCLATDVDHTGNTDTVLELHWCESLNHQHFRRLPWRLAPTGQRLAPGHRKKCFKALLHSRRPQFCGQVHFTNGSRHASTPTIKEKAINSHQTIANLLDLFAMEACIPQFFTLTR